MFSAINLILKFMILFIESWSVCDNLQKMKNLLISSKSYHKISIQEDGGLTQSF